MKRNGLMIGIVSVVFSLCFIGQTFNVFAATSTKSKSKSIAYLFPYKAGFRYPNIPSEFRISKSDKQTQHLLRVAKSRSEIVKWADKNYIYLVQNLGPNMFLVSKDIGSGIRIYVFYLYLQVNDDWLLVYVGDGGLKGQEANYWECAYFNMSKKAVVFTAKDGRVLSTLSIGHEMKLLHQ